MNTVITYVHNIYFKDQAITKFTAQVHHEEYQCINYNQLTGHIDRGDKIVLNTTAMDLKLGTGDYHFLIANLSKGAFINNAIGHVMKLKYTPLQFNCFAVEAQESPFHDVFNTFNTLDDLPVFVGSLHSMLSPASICMKAMHPNIKIVYIMTGSGALPISFSDTVRALKEQGYIHSTITCGNAFGGDMECVNIYSALIAAKAICHADAVIVCMGPGITGTDTKYGFSGIEQGDILDAVNALKGKAIAIPRISFTDERSRHYGLSHHTLTVLSQICHTSAHIALPIFESEKNAVLQQQIRENRLDDRHNISYVNTESYKEILSQNEALLCKMKKPYIKDQEFFLGCGVSASFLPMIK